MSTTTTSKNTHYEKKQSKSKYCQQQIHSTHSRSPAQYVEINIPVCMYFSSIDGGVFLSFLFWLISIGIMHEFCSSHTQKLGEKKFEWAIFSTLLQSICCCCCYDCMFIVFKVNEEEKKLFIQFYVFIFFCWIKFGEAISTSTEMTILHSKKNSTKFQLKMKTLQFLVKVPMAFFLSFALTSLSYVSFLFIPLLLLTFRSSSFK